MGLLFINSGIQDLYLPIFHNDRNFALSVLTDAMKIWSSKEREIPLFPSCAFQKSSCEFYEIADDLGKERSKSPIFIGPEAVSDQCLGGVEYACKHASYIFFVDFWNRKIETIK